MAAMTQGCGTMNGTTAIGAHSATHRHGLLHFVEELRRRRVCRAITLYSVALWLVCQVFDVLGGPIGLPDWTLSLIVILGLLGLPIALILSWLFEITPDGVVADTAGARATAPRRPLECVIDCSLLLAALVIGIQLATGAFGRESIAAAPDELRLSVEPFAAASRGDAGALAAGLVVELQRELVGVAGITVVDHGPGTADGEGFSISGVIAVDEQSARVTVKLIDRASREITWSQAFVRPLDGRPVFMAELAREVVRALPFALPLEVAAAPGAAL